MYEWILMGFGLVNAFIVHLYTKLQVNVTTSLVYTL
jgi:hypothetical protein